MRTVRTGQTEALLHLLLLLLLLPLPYPLHGQAEDELEEAQRHVGCLEAQRQGRTSMSELMRSGSVSISRGAANLNMGARRESPSTPGSLRCSGSVRHARGSTLGTLDIVSRSFSLATSRLSKCRLSGMGGSSPEHVRGGARPASADGEGGAGDLSVLEQLDEARAAIEMVEGIEAVELVRQRSEPWCGESSPLSRAESEVLDTERELAIAALEHAAERLQQKALREQQKLLEERERRAASSGRGSQSDRSSKSDPSQSPGRPGAASSSSGPAWTPNSAPTSQPTSPLRHKSIGDVPAL